MIEAHIGVVHKVEHLQLRVGRPGQGHSAGAAGEDKARVQFRQRREAGLTIGKDHLELTGINHRSRRKGPLCERGIIVGEIEAVQRDGAGAGVVNLDPGRGLAGAVREARQIVRLHFIDPQRRERRERGEHAVGLAGSGRRPGQQQRRGRVDGGGVGRVGQPHREGAAVGGLQIPEAQGVIVSQGQRRSDVLINRIAAPAAGGGGDQVQARGARMFLRGADKGATEVGGQIPGAAQGRFKTGIGEQVGPAAAGHEAQIVQVDVPRRA